MNAKKIFELISNQLKDVTDEFNIETEIILENIFNLSRSDILFSKKITNYNEKEEYLNSVINKRKNRVPIQYIFNKQYFRSYEFYVDENVLIPRAETEILVDKVIEISKSIKKEKISILDMGTGSGCIAISLAKEIKNSFVIGSDISDKALEIARLNANKVAVNNIDFIKSDKLNFFIDKNIKFDIIVSNPPYIPKKDYLELEPEVKNNEPYLALVGDENDGTSFYRYLAEQGKQFLEDKGFIICEIGINQDKIIKEIFSNFDNLTFFNDYNNIPRIFCAI